MITAATANPNGQIVGATWISTSSPASGPGRSAAPALRATSPTKQNVAAAARSSVVPAGFVAGQPVDGAGDRQEDGER